MVHSSRFTVGGPRSDVRSPASEVAKKEGGMSFRGRRHLACVGRGPAAEANGWRQAGRPADPVREPVPGSRTRRRISPPFVPFRLMSVNSPRTAGLPGDRTRCPRRIWRRRGRTHRVQGSQMKPSVLDSGPSVKFEIKISRRPPVSGLWLRQLPLRRSPRSRLPRP